MWEGGQLLQRSHRIVAKRSEIPSTKSRIHPALTLDIGQHRIQGERIAVNI